MNAPIAITPQAAPSESAILARLLISEGESWEAVNDNGTFPAESFLEYRHQVIYRAMSNLIERDGRLDLLALGSELEKTKELDDAGGMQYLVELSLMIVSDSDKASKQHASLVTEAHTKRKLLALAHDMIEQAGSGEYDVEQIIGTVGSRLDSLADLAMGSQDNNVPVEDCQEVVDEILNQGDTGGSLRRTRFDQLDKLIGGFRPGNLSLIAGRPGSGKTSLALSISVNIATDAKGTQEPVLVFSHEMPRGQLIHRLISGAAEVPVSSITNADCSQADLMRIESAWENVVSDYHIFINDTQGMTPDQIAINARRVKRKHGLGAIVIDFLQQLETMSRRGENLAVSLGRTTKALKKVSQDLDVPVILLSQLNRLVEQRPDKRPVMSDLRDSGAIEEDADVILMVYRDEYYNPESPDKGVAEVLVRKNRFGSPGVAKLGFDAKYTKFTNLAPDYYRNIPTPDDPVAESRGYF